VTDNFLSKFKELDEKAKSYDAILTIALVVPGVLDEKMLYSLRKISDSDDPIAGLDALSAYLDTKLFWYDYERGKNAIHEHDFVNEFNEELRKIKVEVTALDLMHLRARSEDALAAIEAKIAEKFPEHVEQLKDRLREYAYLKASADAINRVTWKAHLEEIGELPDDEK